MKVWVLQIIYYEDTSEKDDVRLFSTPEKAIEYFLNLYVAKDLEQSQIDELKSDLSLSFNDDIGVEIFEREID